jgi:protease PrsW
MVAVVLLASLLLGIAADRFAAHAQTPLERARHLALAGELAAAEQAYLAIVDTHPGDLPVVIELLEVHAHLEDATASPDMPEPPPGAPRARPPQKAVDEGRIDAVVAAPALTGDSAMLARWWREALAHLSTKEQDEVVLRLADREPPAPWANHLVGRQAQRQGDLQAAAKRFAREGASFVERRQDVEGACHIWLVESEWDALATALAQPRFAAQTPASVRMEEATHRRDWLAVARWFFAAQYEGTTLGIALLAGLAGLVWIVICATIGRVDERRAFRAPLYLAAFVLGVASTYLTIAIVLVEENFFHFVERGDPASDAIYFVVGVGLREELAKMLLLLPLVPIIKRWGRRREALACGALVGLGFAAEENLGYFHLGLNTALARFLTANFLHISTTGLVAVALDDAVRGRDDEDTSLSRTLPLVVITHGMWDFLASGSASFGGMGPYLSTVTFIFLARRFVDVIRDLPGREGPLLRVFSVGLAVVAGGTFVYASTLVGPGHAALALASGAIGLGIVVYVFARELGRVG